MRSGSRVVELKAELAARRATPLTKGLRAHADDPLAFLTWREHDFAAITRMICDTAAACSAPVVSALEGGYDLAALGRSARAHVEVLKESAA